MKNENDTQTNAEYFRPQVKNANPPSALCFGVVWWNFFAFGSIGFVFGSFCGGSRLIGALISRWVSF